MSMWEVLIFENGTQTATFYFPPTILQILLGRNMTWKESSKFWEIIGVWIQTHSFCDYMFKRNSQKTDSTQSGSLSIWPFRFHWSILVRKRLLRDLWVTGIGWDYPAPRNVAQALRSYRHYQISELATSRTGFQSINFASNFNCISSATHQSSSSDQLQPPESNAVLRT